MVDAVYTGNALALVPRCAGDRNAVFWPAGGELDSVAVTAQEHR